MRSLLLVKANFQNRLATCVSHLALNNKSVITKTEAIVLRTVDFRESSLIATVISREHGKIAVIAKGARKPKSKFGGKLNPGNILSLIYYYKPTRSVQTLSDTSYKVRLDTLSTDIEKMALSVTSLELISQVLQDGEINETVYDFTHNFLIWLNEQQSVSRRIFPYVQVRLLYILGLGLQVDSGLELGSRQCYLNVEHGTISSDTQSNHSVKLTEKQMKFLIKASTSRNADVLKLKLEPGELSDLIDHLDRYFRYHLEGIKPRKSDDIFDQILKD